MTVQGPERAPEQALPSQTSPPFRAALPVHAVTAYVAAGRAGLSPCQRLSARPRAGGTAAGPPPSRRACLAAAGCGAPSHGHMNSQLPNPALLQTHGAAPGKPSHLLFCQRCWVTVTVPFSLSHRTGMYL